ncbi:MAG: hypothetical protein AABY27_02270, partial [Pseudomonadota bacterium]
MSNSAVAGESNSILSILGNYIKEKKLGNEVYLDFESLSAEAKTKFKPGSQELTEEAIAEAKAHSFDLTQYKAILTYLKHNQMTPVMKAQLVINNYNAGVIDLEKSFRENSIATLVSLYPHYKERMSIEKLLLVTSESMEEGKKNKTTFVHELFSLGCPKEDILYFFKELDKLSQLNPELMSNYLDLSDEDGKSIRQLVEEKSLTERYSGIVEQIKNSCRSLYPPINQNNSNLVVDTHTGSVHGSVDRSLAKL